MMRNLALALFEHERITTTWAKAKEARSFVDQIITLAKEGGLHARRRAMALMGNKVIHLSKTEKVDIVGKVFDEIAARVKNRKGGYTRIIRLARERAGDAAPMVIFELVDRVEKKSKKSSDSVEAATEGEASEAKTPKKTPKKKAAAG
jgi:large subunit ribosomal protein L17